MSMLMMMLLLVFVVDADYYDGVGVGVVASVAGVVCDAVAADICVVGGVVYDECCEVVFVELWDGRAVAVLMCGMVCACVLS